MSDSFFAINGRFPIARNAAPVRFVHQKSIDKPTNHRLHLNDYVEIYIYISGLHRYIVESAVYDLQPGDIIVINPYEVHKALPLCEAVYERFYFTVPCNAFDGMVLNPLDYLLHKPLGSEALFRPDASVRETVLQALYTVSDCFRGEQNEALRALSAFLFILDVLNHMQAQPISDGMHASASPLLARILTYITEHTAEIQSITEIASAMNITPQYLSAYFSKHAGTPLKTYIQAKKIAFAKDLLERGLDVTQTCYDCGFNDCSYFIRIFKKYVGCTPHVYKTRFFL